MSKNKNYQNYKNYSAVSSEEVIPAVDEPTTETTMQDEVSETDTQNETFEPVVETVTGVVTDCVKLRVRKQPNTSAEVIQELEVSSEVIIDTNKSTNEFYKVCTAAGLDGYCMKKFITLK